MVNLCMHDNEWNQAKKMYPCNIENNYLRNDENNKHLICYEGTNIIAYAHLYVPNFTILTLSCNKNIIKHQHINKFLYIIQQWCKNLSNV